MVNAKKMFVLKVFVHFFVEKETEKDKSKKEGLGTFYTFPHYVKFYEVLKGAYSSYKVNFEVVCVEKCYFLFFFHLEYSILL